MVEESIKKINKIINDANLRQISQQPNSRD